MKLDFRKFDDRTEVWGPDASDGEWFLFGTIYKNESGIEFFPEEDLRSVDLPHLKEIVGWMDKVFTTSANTAESSS